MTVITFNGQSIDTPGIIRRATPNAPDLWWAGGDTVALMNGYLQLPVERVSFGSIRMDGQSLEPIDPTLVGTSIEYGQIFVFAVPGYSPPAKRPLPDWYLNGGYELDNLPRLTTYTQQWGPSPDPEVTSSGGSSRLFASRVPGAIATSTELLFGARVTMRAAVLRAAEQGKRACHLYRIKAREDGSLWPEFSNPKIDPDLLCYHGYDSTAPTKGGPSTLYGSKKPAGVTWGETGWAPDDPDHFAQDQTILTAYMLEDDVFAAIAQNLVETGLHVATLEESTGGRGGWHLIRALACFTLINEARALVLLNDQLTRNEDRNVYGDFNPTVIFEDRGNSTDSYHMPPSDTKWMADIIGLSSAQNTMLAKSASSFMVGIAVLACDLALRVPVIWTNSDLRTRLYTQMEIGTALLVGPAMYRAVNVQTKEFAWPSDGIMWDDVAPPLFGFQTWRAKGGSKSVGPRFIRPALAAGYSWLMKQEVKDAFEKVTAGYGIWPVWLETWPCGNSIL